MSRFVGTCVELGRRQLEEFDDSSREITYRTFAKHVGKAELAWINSEFGTHPHVKNDYAVSFAKGEWRGKPAVCMFHSRIHHIWLV